ncbi:hypothetical protein [uncultured Algoriphagus sp.]|uniref:hypothetical protein n=1 Tax=uncultured Algoriphagus sp. TaxID=417365 RepID=UPI0030ED5E66|tara:strand:+ start:28546 stop:29118 length:573 start_codon:yes stop_codon:yes gene_type:complete
MTENEFKNIEFYQNQYYFEHERRKFYDRLIQYPTTLLVIFVGASLYSLNKYFPIGINNFCLESDWFFSIIFGLFSLSTIITICFLGIMFHGFTRKYEYLPYTGELQNHELELYKYYYKYSKKKKYKNKRKDAKIMTCKNFTANLKMYYINTSQVNQEINDKRADSYYLTRTFLFIDLVLLIILGTMGYLK